MGDPQGARPPGGRLLKRGLAAAPLPLLLLAALLGQAVIIEVLLHGGPRLASKLPLAALLALALWPRRKGA